MKRIVVGTTEIEVIKANAFVYEYGRGEKVVIIEVADGVVSFDDMKNLLDGNKEPIQYFDDDTLICEYVGYEKFEGTYANGVYKIELHKAGVSEQMAALLTANEKLNTANATLQETANSLTEQNYILAEQNIMLSSTLSEVLENIIPGFLAEVIGMVGELEARVSTLETVTGETVSE